MCISVLGFGCLTSVCLVSGFDLVGLLIVLGALGFTVFGL